MSMSDLYSESYWSKTSFPLEWMKMIWRWQFVKQYMRKDEPCENIKPARGDSFAAQPSLTITNQTQPNSSVSNMPELAIDLSIYNTRFSLLKLRHQWQLMQHNTVTAA
ncbi:unnamed protein product [Didymodactylos carnosus]|uniref:Uncharacterized protein n=1 Tax=Didymodactylos carnosus TaxID=1234261 RepID=A0A815FZX7_9BILA|nr:unnamed protein product [Didymodactylos carnosus]CAF1332088.1 unnamed protein product [Didymodactylos carnosus]CAF3978480.1 unnamed protein product [Didymodactylos carnosus]CAF4186482.1 unnamed protein product [Didymodactylos carnosus]